MKVGTLDKGNFLLKNRRESLKNALLVVGPHLKRDFPAQVKVNAILAAELEKEKNNDAEMSKVNSLAFLKDKVVGEDMILVRNSNRFR